MANTVNNLSCSLFCAKRSIIDIWLGSECAYAPDWRHSKNKFNLFCANLSHSFHWFPVCCSKSYRKLQGLQINGDMGTKLVDPFICLLLFENSRLPKSRKNPPKNYPISSEPWAHWLTNRMGHYHSQNLTKPNSSHNEVT